MSDSRRALLRLFASAGFLALLSGCGGDDNNGSSTPTNNGPVTASQQFGNLLYTLSATKAVYPVGESIPLTFSVKNTGAQSVTFTFGSGVTSQVQVAQGTDLLWFTPEGGSAAITDLTIAPGQTRTFQGTWDQKRHVLGQQLIQGSQVPSGVYTASAYLPGVGPNGNAGVSTVDLSAQAHVNISLVIQ